MKALSLTSGVASQTVDLIAWTSKEFEVTNLARGFSMETLLLSWFIYAEEIVQSGRAAG